VRAIARPLAAPAAAALALSLGLLLLSVLTPAFTDYESEAEGAFTALQHGDLDRFLALAPAYGGSLVLRAPFALLPLLWGGGDLALFRAVSVPGALATAALAVAVFAAARAAGQAQRTAWIALGLVAASPMAMRALEIGHPEELVGGTLCVGALLAAARGRAMLAAVLLGLALANKPWAVLAVVPVLAALPTGRRARALAVAAAVAALVLAPILLHGGQSLQATATTAHSAGQIFQPWQVFWFFGEHGRVVVGSFGAKPGYRAAPDWAGRISHPLVVLVGVGVALAWCARRRGARAAAPTDALLLLALVLLLRSLLDTWSIGYYHLPFLLALTAWEVQARRGLPVLALGATGLLWATTDVLTRVASPDVQAAAYLAWAVPLALLLGLRLLAPARFAAVARPATAALSRALPSLAQATTRSSLGSELSTSQPSSVMATRSSIRTPVAPGT
jgi:hypothetical protein